jgi:hypothetical protein
MRTIHLNTNRHPQLRGSESKVGENGRNKKRREEPTRAEPPPPSARKRPCIAGVGRATRLRRQVWLATPPGPSRTGS